MKNLVVVCADIGSTARGNFGWWSSAGCEGTLPSTLASHVAEQLNAGCPVALGFECPLFVPLNADEMRLTNARPGEGARPWSAGAGCGALATGIVQSAWVLQEIRQLLKAPRTAYCDWEGFVRSGSGLLIWEAFVSGKGKADGHVADAQAAAAAFEAALPDPRKSQTIQSASPVISLIGAALIRSGWSQDQSLLGQPCIVISAGS